MIPFLEGQEEIYLVYIGLALGVFLLITGLGQLLARGENQIEARNRRMRMIGRGASAEEVFALLRPSIGSGALNWLPVLSKLSKQMARAGMTITLARLLLFCAMGGIAAGAVAVQFLSPFHAAAIAVLLTILVPFAIVSAMCHRRITKMVSQLPDALELVARGLKVGHPLNTSVGAVAREMPDPIGTEFGLIFDQVSYGDDLVSAFQDFSDRVDIEDVHYLSVSIAIQHGTGGDLARVVEILAKTIRARIAMRQRIKAVSAEGRLSALLLTAMPFLLFISVSLGSPDYYRGVADDPLFMPMAVGTLTLVLANALILRKLVNFRV